jgi:hypothetical protein
LPAEQSRRDIAFKRAGWKAQQGKVDPKRLIFIDETWIKTNMAPLRGWRLGPMRNFWARGRFLTSNREPIAE